MFAPGPRFNPNATAGMASGFVVAGSNGACPSCSTGSPAKRWCMAVLPTSTASNTESGEICASVHIPASRVFNVSIKIDWSFFGSSRFASGIGDTADDILTKGDLGVHCSSTRDRCSSAQVYQVGGQLGGADIHCQPMCTLAVHGGPRHKARFLTIQLKALGSSQAFGRDIQLYIAERFGLAGQPDS